MDIINGVYNYGVRLDGQLFYWTAPEPLDLNDTALLESIKTSLIELCNEREIEADGV